MKPTPVIKHPYRSNVRWALMQWADIEDPPNPGHVYLRRLRIIQCPLFALYLHFIYTEDRDRDPHNHPMNFWSFIVKGGYKEHRYRHEHGIHYLGSRTRRRFSFARTTMEDFHQIIKIDTSPTITLLFVGKRAQSWGFLTDSGFIDKSVYLARKNGA